MAAFMSLVKECFSAPGDLMVDDARIAAFLVVLCFIALSVYTVVVLKKPFDPQTFGIGCGGMGTGIGAWFFGRKGN